MLAQMLGTMLVQMSERHFCDTLPSHRDCVADDLEQPGRKKRMNDKKRHVLCFGLYPCQCLQIFRMVGLSLKGFDNNSGKKRGWKVF